MRCIVCHRGMAEGITLHRTNRKGEPGIWACDDHISEVGRMPAKDASEMVDGLMQRSLAMTDSNTGADDKDMVELISAAQEAMGLISETFLAVGAASRICSRIASAVAAIGNQTTGSSVAKSVGWVAHATRLQAAVDEINAAMGAAFSAYGESIVIRPGTRFNTEEGFAQVDIEVHTGRQIFHPRIDQ